MAGLDTTQAYLVIAAENLALAIREASDAGGGDLAHIVHHRGVLKDVLDALETIKRIGSE